MSKSSYMVVWDNGQDICVPMVWDGGCRGGVCAMSLSKDDVVAVFADRKSARTAISISVKWAELCRMQGRIYNSDFIADARRCLRIVKCGGME